MHQVDHYDGDLDDPRQRCEHGTFIGSWWGPDYLCFPCEMGITKLQWEHTLLLKAVRTLEHHPMFWIISVDDMFTGFKTAQPYSAPLAQAITDMVLANYDEIRYVLRSLRRARARVRLFLYAHRDELEEIFADA